MFEFRGAAQTVRFPAAYCAAEELLVQKRIAAGVTRSEFLRMLTLRHIGAHPGRVKTVPSLQRGVRLTGVRCGQ